MANYPTLHLSLITLLGEKLAADVYEVILPTRAGEIAVLPGHEPLITLAAPGVLSVRRKKTDPDSALEFFATSGGIIEIDQTRVRVLVDEADHGDDIIEAESQKALERALQLRERAGSQVELDEANRLVNRHQIRLKVAGLRRHQQKTRYK
ncbi:MAG: ATP synthase F1 subunit epsilon [Candidatus Nomurabacteria bacterium]|jgi:F-type H+-transporting ATPase subunit epsilon|nr:ATP synthase F1 subunit epsilon [Candidatus Nomurabacteria bacterium]